ncbi:hypothetical protein [Actinoplanes sp. NPDC051494]|uniref:hypothetical protein n=1 Tax=Actinoplanes sp. NPDC051494 TaxID=3363907 RepID=UPI0037B377D7
MLKSEHTIDMVKRRLTGSGPVRIVDLIWDAHLLTVDGDLRWIGNAMYKLDDAGVLRHVTCDPEHDHTDACTVELIGA